MGSHATAVTAAQALPDDLRALLERAQEHKRLAQRHRRKAQRLMQELAARGVDLRSLTPDMARKEA